MRKISLVIAMIATAALAQGRLKWRQPPKDVAVDLVGGELRFIADGGCELHPSVTTGTFPNTAEPAMKWSPASKDLCRVFRAEVTVLVARDLPQ